MGFGGYVRCAVARHIVRFGREENGGCWGDGYGRREGAGTCFAVRSQISDEAGAVDLELE